MPLRGKILNVEKALEHRMWDNQEIKNMFIALGVKFGTAEDSKALNLEGLRYDKIISAFVPLELILMPAPFLPVSASD